MSDAVVSRFIFASPALTQCVRVARAMHRSLAPKLHDPDFAALRTLDLQGKLVLDIGANVGQSATSILAAAPGAMVLSIEPNPLCHPALRLTARMSRGRVTVLAAGVGNTRGRLPFYVPLRNGRQLSEEGTFIRSALDDPAVLARNPYSGIEVTDIPVLTIDSLGLSPVFIKIDVQGAEKEALEGGLETIRRTRPGIMIEVGPGWEACADLLQPLGYAARYWNGRALVPEVVGGAVNMFFLPSGQTRPS